MENSLGKEVNNSVCPEMTSFPTLTRKDYFVKVFPWCQGTGIEDSNFGKP